MVYDTDEGDNYARAIHAGFLYLFPRDLVENVFGGAWTVGERSRAPYTDTWLDTESGISLYASPNLTHATIEISGSGCELLIEAGKMEQVLQGCAGRITRIDIACDIETKTMPMDFVAKRDHERMRSNGMMNSDTGETCYIGSKQSERFARVYRYFPPHPRAHLLRVEMVFRREHAKKIATSIVASGICAVASEAGKAFGWAHSDWEITSDNEVDLSITSPERNAGKTVSWLVRSVGPAIQRLIADGTIRDPEAFFKTYFLPPEGHMLD